MLLLSTPVREPVDGWALASAFRPALAMTAKALADELGPQRGPGQHRAAGADGGGRPHSGPRPGRGRHRDAEQAPAWIPLQRPGEPLELARPAVFLLSPAAGYVTGTTFAVDGGSTRTL